MKTTHKCEYCEEELDLECDDITTKYDSRGNEIYYHEDCYSEVRDMEYEARCEAMEASRYDGDDYLIDGVGFADPGGRSALRAETDDNPRNLPCPNCGSPNRLTPLDRARGYQCDSCADRAERGFDY